MSTRILVVDDDPNIGRLISLYLNKEGWETVIAQDGGAALDCFKKELFDLVVLDVMMPVKDGFEVLKELRQTSTVPVVMLTARGESADRITGLDYGADDYLSKPFESQELILRIKAILRRISNKQNDKSLRYGELEVDMSAYTVIKSGQPIIMTPKEIELLAALMVHPNRVMTRNELAKTVWDNNFKEKTRTVDVHMKRIREKVGSGAHWTLSTVWGRGYKFETEAS